MLGTWAYLAMLALSLLPETPIHAFVLRSYGGQGKYVVVLGGGLAGITAHILLDAGPSLLLAAAMYFEQQGGIIIGDPSYADLLRKAGEFKSPIVAVAPTADYKLDLDAMEKKADAPTTLVCICNPNSPTDTALDAAQLKALAARVSQKVPVSADETYIDYLLDPRAASLMDAVRHGQNALVVRALSKP